MKVVSGRWSVVGKSFFCVKVCALLLALCAPVAAQQTEKLRRIGFLGAAFPSSNPARREALRQGLHALGWMEGKNRVIEWRFAEGSRDRLSKLGLELARIPVEVIVAGGPGPTRALKEANLTVPVVMGFDNDPVGSGFVGSLARPGGNITGLSTLSPEISGKQLELLKEIVPKLSRVAVLGNSAEPGNAQALKELGGAAGAFRVQLQYLEILQDQDLETAFKAATKKSADAVLVLGNPIASARRARIAAAAAKSRLPGIYPWPEFVNDGGLMSYGANMTDLFRRAAWYVDKILKGAKPADIPVEQPTKFELAINLKTAKQIGLTIPPNVLARADRIIR
jgi:putative tryptophan/tyrosine transport system substrate-binding protein